MTPQDAAAFDRIAGDVLTQLGYASDRRRPLRAVPAEAWYRLRMGAWNAVAHAIQRSPLWRRRHARLF